MPRSTPARALLRAAAARVARSLVRQAASDHATTRSRLLETLERRQLMTVSVDPIPTYYASEGDYGYDGLYASFSDDSNYNYHSATVNWGDGTTEEVYVDDWGGSGYVYAYHPYADDGTYNGTLTVRDDAGGSGSASFTAVVGKVDPYLSIGGPGGAIVGQPYTLNLSSWDPGADTISSWTVNWGDGSAPQQIAGHPSSATHTYAQGGQSYTITASATDEDGTYAANGLTVATATFDPPSDLRAVVASASRVDLYWADHADSESYFRLERSTNGGQSWQEFAVVGANQTSFQTTDLQPGTRYDFRVRAQHNSGAHSSYANVVTVTTLGFAPPTNLTVAVVDADRVDLAWEDHAEHEAYFRLERSADNGATWQEFAVLGANQTSYRVEGLEPGTRYVFRVRAQHGNGAHSVYSNRAAATTRSFGGPADLAARTVSGSRVMLSWRDAAEEESYFRIELREEGGQWHEVAIVGADQTSHSLGGLQPGRRYDFRVRAQHGNGTFSAYTDAATATTVTFGDPTDLAATVVSGSRVDLAWSDNSDDEAYFRIERSSDGGATWQEIAVVGNDQTSHQVTGLDPGQAYQFRVRAQHGNGTRSGYTNAAAVVTTAFAAPGGLAAAVRSSSRVDLHWTDNSDNESYFRVERSTDGGQTWHDLVAVGAGQTSFELTGLAPGTRYDFRVRAQHGNGSYSTYSNAVAATTSPFAAPTGLAVVARGGERIDLSWADRAEDESYFRVERSADGGASWQEIGVTGANQTSFAATDLRPGTRYDFRVRGHHPNGTYSAYTNVAGTSTAAFAAPGGLTAQVVSEGRIDLRWADASDNESYFRLERSTDGGATWAEFAVTSANVTAYSVADVTPGQPYQFRVRAQHPNATYSAYSGVASATPAGFGAPSDLSAATSWYDDGEVGLTWRNNARGEAGFKVERRLAGSSSWAVIATLGAGATSHNVSGLDPEETYEFRVRAYKADGTYTAYSNVAGIGIEALPGPTALAATTLAGERVRLRWQDNAGAEYSYRVERSADGGATWQEIAGLPPDQTSFVADGLDPGATYSFRVRAQHGNGRFSNFSGAVTVTTTALAAPSLLTATTVSGSRIDLAWADNAENEQDFRVERSDDGGATWHYVAGLSANATSYQATDLQPGNTYQFRIRATHWNGTSSGYTNVASATTVAFAAPTNLTAVTVDGSRIDLAWADNADNERDYRVERSADGGATWQYVAGLSANTTSYQATGLEPGTAYRFRVRASHWNGSYSAYTNVVAAATVNFAGPTELAATVIAGDRIDLAWSDHADNERDYRVERSADGGATWQYVAGLPANATSYQATGLEPGTTYSFRVRASHWNGTYSPYSNLATAQTIVFAAPTGLTAVTVDGSRIDLAWADNADNEQDYRVERSADGGATWQYVAGLPANTTSYKATGLEPGTAYRFRVRAAHANGSFSPYTNVASATTVAFAAPSALTATVISGSRIDLAWTDQADNERDYRVERSADGGATWQYVAGLGANTTSYQATGLEPGTTYSFRVRASHWNGTYSPYSNVVVRSTVPFDAPSALQVTRVSDARAELKWIDNTDNERDFRVERSADGGATWQYIAGLGANTTSYSATGLEAGVEYQFRVRSSHWNGTYSAYALGGTGRITVAAPQNLSATAAQSGIARLTWQDASANETGFRVERRPEGAAVWEEVAILPGGTSGYEELGLPAGRYAYRVRSFYNSNIFSDYTAEAVVEIAQASVTLAVVRGTMVAGESDASRWVEVRATLANTPTWEIDWGDGSPLQRVSSDVTTAKHRYLAGGASYTVRAFTANSTPSNAVVVQVVAAPSNRFQLTADFGPAGSPTVDGYVRVGNELFGERGAYQMGWSGSGVTTSQRPGGTTADARYAGYAKPFSPADGVSRSFEVAVPNGTYRVRLVAGSPDEAGVTQKFRVEGQSVIAATTSAASPFVTGVAFVTVTDGRLTIAGDASAPDSQLSFVDVVAAERTGVLPAAPAGVAAVLTASKTVQLTWDDRADNEGVDPTTFGTATAGAVNRGYKVERRALVGGNWGAWTVVGYALGSAERYVDASLASGGTYMYRVAAMNAAGESSGVESGTVTFGSYVYANDFESGQASNLSKTQTSVTPIGNRRFLGRFGNDTVTLSLSNLPDHEALRVTLDLFIIQSWDGSDDTIYGKDTWGLRAGAQTLVEATFSNHRTPTGTARNDLQSYPDSSTSGIDHASYTGAAEAESLGYMWSRHGGQYPLSEPMSAVYAIDRSFAHAGSSVAIAAYAFGLQGLNDESWGLDDLRVELALLAPTNLTATPNRTAGNVALAWSDESGHETAYVIERAIEGQPFREIGRAGPNAESYVDATAKVGVHYVYRVYATNDTIRSGVSDPASATLDARYTPTSIQAPSTATEGDAVTASIAPVAGATGYVWGVFRDGQLVANGAGSSMTFVPPDEGSYRLEVRALVDGFVSEPAIHELTVSNASPVVRIVPLASAVVERGHSVSFSGSSSDAGLQDVATPTWRVVANGAEVATGQGWSLEYTPTLGGKYYAELSVADGDGGTGAARVEFEVVGGPTLAITGTQQWANEGESVTYVGTIESGTGEARDLRFTVLRGDDTVASGAGDRLTFVPPDDGQYRVIFNAVDDAGTGQAEVGLVVYNVAPKAKIETQTFDVATGLRVLATASAADPGAAEGLTYRWTLRDADGTVLETGTGERYDFNPDDGESYSLELVVTDKDGGRDAVRSDFAFERHGVDGLIAEPILTADVAPAAATYAAPPAEPDRRPKLFVQWVDRAADDTGFMVFVARGDEPFGPVPAATVGHNVTGAEIAGLDPGRRYRVKVRTLRGSLAFADSKAIDTFTIPDGLSLSAGVPTNTSVALNWGGANADVERFEIERRAAGDGVWASANTATGLGASVGATTVNGLKPGVDYHFRIRAIMPGGLAGPWSDAVSRRTTAVVPATPSGLTVTPTTPTFARLEWNDASDDEDGFRIEQRTAQGDWSRVGSALPNASSFVVATLIPGRFYEFRVTAFNAAGDGVPTQPAAFSAPSFDPPTMLGATRVAPTSVKITWQDQTAGETHFLVEAKADDEAGFLKVATAASNETGVVLDSLRPGRTYSFRVAAVVAPFNNWSHRSSYSAVATATTLGGAPAPATPILFEATPHAGSPRALDLSWSYDAGSATGFEIIRTDSGPGGAVVKFRVDASARSFVDHSLPIGAASGYAIRALGASGSSPWTFAAGNANSFTAPRNVEAYRISPTAVELNWTDSTSGEAEFYVSRLVESGAAAYWERVATVDANETSIVLDDAPGDATIIYRVDAGGSDEWGTFVVEGGEVKVEGSTPAPTVPERPVSPAAVASASPAAIDFSWGVTDVDTPRVSEVWISGDGETYSLHYSRNYEGGAVAGSATNSTTLGRLTGGQHYWVKVRAWNGAGASEFSDPVEVDASPGVDVSDQRFAPERPTDLAATPSGPSGITLSWVDASANETYFIVEASRDGTTFYRLGATSAPKGPATGQVLGFGVKSLTPGTKYYFRVRATNGAGASSATPTVDATTLPFDPPRDLVAVARSDSQISLAWRDEEDPAVGEPPETSFIVERAVGDGKFVRIGSSPADRRSFLVSDLNIETQYHFRVRAVAADGSLSVYSNVVSAETLPARLSPAAADLEADALTATSAMLRWSDPSRLETYWQAILWEDDADVADREFRASDLTDLRLEGLKPNTLYNVRVRGHSAGGWSDPSNLVSFHTYAEIKNPTATVAGPDVVLVKWAYANDASTAGVTYTIQRRPATSTSDADWSTLTTAATGGSYTDAGIGAPFVYRVAAVNAAGTSAFSGELKPQLSAPVAKVGGVTPRSLTVSWTGVALATGYRVERMTAPDRWDDSVVVGPGARSQTFDDLGEASAQQVRVIPLHPLATSAGAAVTAYTAVPAPTALTPTFLDADTVAFTWRNATASVGSTTILALVGGIWKPIATASGNNESATAAFDFDPDATYEFRAEARYGAAVSLDSAASRATVTSPSFPRPVSGFARDDGRTGEGVIALKWTSGSANETGFVIERASTSNGAWRTIATLPASARTFEDAQASNGATYRYRIWATNALGRSRVAEATIGGRLAALSGLAAFGSLLNEYDRSPHFTVTWSRPRGPSHAVEVQYRAVGDLDWQDAPAGASANGRLKFGAEFAPSTDYEFRARVVDTQFLPSEYTPVAVGRSRSYPKPPANVAATTVSAGVVAVGWSAASNDETGFTIFRRAGGAWTQIGLAPAGATTFRDGDAPENGTVEYRVRASNAYGDSSDSAVASAAVPMRAPAAFNVDAITGSYADLTWIETSTGETAYEVREVNTGKTWTVAKNEHSFRLFGSFEASTKYTFSIRALGAVPSALAFASATTAAFPAAPANFTAKSVSRSRIDLRWDVVPGASDYVILRRTSGQGWALLVDGTAATSYADEDVSPQRYFHYKVIARNAAGESPASEEVTLIPLLEDHSNATDLLETNATQTTIDLAWNAAANLPDQTYYVQRSADGASASFQTIATVVGQTTFTDVDLTPGTTYFYRVATGKALEQNLSNVACGITDGVPVVTGGAPIPAGYPYGAADPNNRANLQWYRVRVNKGFEYRGSSFATVSSEIKVVGALRLTDRWVLAPSPQEAFAKAVLRDTADPLSIVFGDDPPIRVPISDLFFRQSGIAVNVPFVPFDPSPPQLMLAAASAAASGGGYLGEPLVYRGYDTGRIKGGDFWNPGCIGLTFETPSPGTTNPNDDPEEPEEEPIKQTVGVNDLDDDGDGIPGYADGFDLKTGDDEKADDAADSVMSPLASVGAPIGDADHPTMIRFSFSSSNPGGVTRTHKGIEADPYQYAPGGGGSIRLWNTAGASRDKRPFAPDGGGGNLIQSGVTYKLHELGNVIVEAVRRSGSRDDIVVNVSYTPDGGETTEKKILITAVGGDVDVDSDHTGAIGDGGGAPEDQGEQRADLPGQILVVNNGDVDKDKVIDLADGFNLGAPGGADGLNAKLKFVPVTIQLPSPLDIDKASLTISYDASDPDPNSESLSETQRTAFIGSANLGWRTAPGSLRLWTKDGNKTRDPRGVKVGGNFVTPGLYDTDELSSLGFSSSRRQVTFYVEAVAASNGTIRLSIDPDGVTGPGSAFPADAVRLTSVDAPAPDAAEEAGVRLVDGAATFASTDLVDNGFGTPWGHTRVYSNAAEAFLGGSGRGNGSGFAVSDWPYLVNAGNAIVAVLNGVGQFFDRVGDTFMARFGGLDLLKRTGATYTLYRASGEQVTFSGFDSSVPHHRRGQFETFADAGGNVTKVSKWTTGDFAGRIAEIERPKTPNRDEASTKLTYSYFADNDGEFAGLLKEVKLTNAKGFVRRAVYTYYTKADGKAAPEDFRGSARDLKSVVIHKAATDSPIERKYYRYLPKSDPSRGSRLSLAIEGANYARFVKDRGQEPAAASTEELSPYADFTAGYSGYRVLEVGVQGAGAASAASPNGQGRITVIGNGSGNRVGFNSWDHVGYVVGPHSDWESSPSLYSYYLNFAGQAMLRSDWKDNRKLNHTFHQYDDKGRLVFTAMPSALVDLDLSAVEANHDLLGLEGDTYTLVDDDGGLQYRYTYNADDASAPGRLSETGIRHGKTGAWVKQQTQTYVQAPFSEAPIYLPERTTVYKDEAGAQAIHTTTTYEWLGDSAQPTTATVTLPTVSGAAAAILVYAYDKYGRLRQFTDAAGGVSRTEYDEADETGAVIKSSRPGIDTAHPLVNSVTAWDALGRPTAAKDERGLVTTIQYTENETIRSVKTTYVGQASGNASPPTNGSIVESRWADGTVETRSIVNGAERLVLRETLDGGGRTLKSERGSGNGTFYTTQYEYDGSGRLKAVTDAVGVARRAKYDQLGRVIGEYVGGVEQNVNGRLEYVGAKLVKSYEYDDGGAGDGNLTKVTLHPSGELGGTAAMPNRVTEIHYDWRDRAIVTDDGISVVAIELDNLGRTTGTTTYDAAAVGAPTTVDGVPTMPASAAAGRRARTTQAFDDRGRLTDSVVYGVNQTSGNFAGGTQTTRMKYDARDLLTRLELPGGAVITHEYDPAGRDTLTSMGSDAFVAETTKTQYNATGTAVSIERTQYPSAGGAPHVQHLGQRYDSLGRLTAEAVSSSAMPLAGDLPGRSDATLLTTFVYDDAGFLSETVDPRGIRTWQEHDWLGRLTWQVENAGEFAGNGAPPNDARSTRYSYDGLDRLTSVDARNVVPGGATENFETSYHYGENGAEAGGVTPTNADLAYILYPGGFKESYAHNALGEVVARRDRNGTLHMYELDQGGRMTGDVVTDWGPGGGSLDQYVDKLAYDYDALGRVTSARSEGGTPAGWATLNEVRREYDAFGQLARERQAHAGAVDATTPAVAYDRAMVGGAWQLTEMRYPDGSRASYAYDAMGRVAGVGFLGGAAAGPPAIVEAYDYLGVSTLVGKRRDAAGQADLTVTLDALGRAVSVAWKDAAGAPVDGYAYGYDRAGNKLYAENLNNPGLSELWHGSGVEDDQAYSGLGYVTHFRRGQLSANKRSLTSSVAASSATYVRDTQGSLITGGPSSTNGAGNTSGFTSASGNGIEARYDAWNRLRETTFDGGGEVVDHVYDALGRLIYTAEQAQVVFKHLQDTRHYYYDSAGQVIEERPGGSGSADVRYVISAADGQIVLRDRDADGDASHTLEQRVYALQDASGNTTALADSSGAVVERYVYDALGNVQALDAAWGERTITYAGGASGTGWGDGRYGDQMLGEYFAAKPSHGMLGSGASATFSGGGGTALAGSAYAWRHYAGGTFYDRVPGVYLDAGGGGASDPRSGRALTPDLAAMGLGFSGYGVLPGYDPTMSAYTESGWWKVLGLTGVVLTGGVGGWAGIGYMALGTLGGAVAGGVVGEVSYGDPWRGAEIGATVGSFIGGFPAVFEAAGTGLARFGAAGARGTSAFLRAGDSAAAQVVGLLDDVTRPPAAALAGGGLLDASAVGGGAVASATSGGRFGPASANWSGLFGNAVFSLNISFNGSHASAPSPRPIGPDGGMMQSHHGLQGEWAEINLSAFGYRRRLAPTVNIETGAGMPHTIISTLQNARRDARVATGLGKWSSTLQQELGYIVSDFRAAGFSDPVIKKVLAQQYRMLDKLGVPYTRIKGV